LVVKDKIKSFRRVKTQQEARAINTKITAGSLHIVEPTLTGESGHCFSFVSSLVYAAGDFPLSVWCGRKSAVSFPGNVRVKRLFVRRVRRLQSLWLYRHLLQSQDRIFVPTADRTDLILFNLAAKGKIAHGKAYLFVHWFRPSPSKHSQLEKLARRQPGLVILTSAESVFEEFRSAGFRDTRLVPYPVTPCESTIPATEQHGFKHLLYAGAARQDKGFRTVVDLVQLMAADSADLPITLQTSADHYDKYDEATKADLRRLEKCTYSHIRCVTETLPQAKYQALFSGAICLQLYSRRDFIDRISGITLDALSNGSPVLTLSGTWMARVVAQYEAGLVVDSSEPRVVYRAAKQIVKRYEYYREKAFQAGQELQIQNSAAHLFNELVS
jgi:glycosyltransferase involved in cell wall biosynthesis